MLEIARKIRLAKARLFGSPIGEWQAVDLVIHKGKYCVWRLADNGDYEYREATEDQQQSFMESNVW